MEEPKIGISGKALKEGRWGGFNASAKVSTQVGLLSSCRLTWLKLFTAGQFFWYIKGPVNRPMNSVC